MSVVVDANVLMATASSTSVGEAARERLTRWRVDGEDLHVPNLFIYEVANAIAGLEALGELSPQGSDALWTWIDALDLTSHPPCAGRALTAIAHRLQRRSACDAAYVDVALQIDAELWTLDGKLARNASSIGLPVLLLI